MTHERMLQKMQTYWEWWQEGAYKEKLGVNRFRVLTITPSEERKENLRKITKQADTRKQGSDMFLFACENEYSLQKPEAVLDPIWLSPKDDAPHHLLE